MKLKKPILNQAGDTIIEVLISVVVVGLAIGLAYGTSSRSLKGMRQSQERGEALKKVEGQIERLKSLAHANKENLFTAAQPAYCLVGSGTTGTVKKSTGFTDLPDLNADPLGTAYNDCVDGLYHLAITPSASDQFTITARWFSLGSNAKDQVSIKYRIHESES